MKRKIIKFMSVLCMMMSFTLCVHAAGIVDSGECGGYVNLGDDTTCPVYYTLYSDGKMVINGSGIMRSYMGDIVPWDNYKKDIKSLVVEQGVTNVGTDTFADCVNLTDVHLVEGVETIGVGAFSGCTKLKDINLPKTLTTIYWSAFSGCGSLTKIEIPLSINNIHHAAFLECENLKDVYYNGSEKQWNEIVIESGENECLLNANIHYNSSAEISVPAPKCFTISGSRVTNTADTEQTATIITAQYSGNKLTDVTSKEITFAANEAKTFTVPTGGKLFVWDILSGMCPLTK